MGGCLWAGATSNERFESAHIEDNQARVSLSYSVFRDASVHIACAKDSLHNPESSMVERTLRL